MLITDNVLVACAFKLHIPVQIRAVVCDDLAGAAHLSGVGSFAQLLAEVFGYLLQFRIAGQQMDQVLVNARLQHLQDQFLGREQLEGLQANNLERIGSVGGLILRGHGRLSGQWWQRQTLGLAQGGLGVLLALGELQNQRLIRQRPEFLLEALQPGLEAGHAPGIDQRLDLVVSAGGEAGGEVEQLRQEATGLGLQGALLAVERQGPVMHHRHTLLTGEFGEIEGRVEQVAAHVVAHPDQGVVDTEEVDVLRVVAEGEGRLVEGAVAQQLPVLLVLEQEGIQLGAGSVASQLDQS